MKSAHARQQWLIRVWGAGIFLFLALAVVYMAKQGYLRYVWDAALAPPRVSGIRLDDGARSLYYRIRLGKGKPQALVFFCGGSTPVSLRYYLRAYLEDFPENAVVYALQKRHLGDWSLAPARGFDRDNYLERWIADNACLIRRILRQEKHPGQVMALGVSEGGNVAAVMAARFPEISRLIVLGSGGMRQAEELARLSPVGSRRVLAAQYREIMAAPDQTGRRFWGWPYKYWAHVLFFDPMPYYARLAIPVFVAAGERDRSVPVESIRYLAGKFRALGKRNLTVLIQKGCDHTFRDARGMSQRREVFRSIGRWLQRS